MKPLHSGIFWAIVSSDGRLGTDFEWQTLYRSRAEAMQYIDDGETPIKVRVISAEDAPK